MTRNEYEDAEALATVALAGLLARGTPFTPEDIASHAFEIAEAFQQEKLKRIGEKPPYDF
ncbi:hypothetical protein GXB78_06435 [Pseudomonas moraviensis subsp. stanleyae]|uniref:hypothetical protein n=1 Tax=Pseudomonas moraviensis TaxID=321662 RepID=UPI002E3773C2|nr:hypothetical protein [Pseudomonas moraviensis]MED7666842.1 hypothetical protein [Pseudomonas moraviensis subsp. stanleyae]